MQVRVWVADINKCKAAFERAAGGRVYRSGAGLLHLYTHLNFTADATAWCKHADDIHKPMDLLHLAATAAACASEAASRITLTLPLEFSHHSVWKFRFQDLSSWCSLIRQL